MACKIHPHPSVRHCCPPPPHPPTPNFSMYVCVLVGVVLPLVFCVLMLLLFANSCVSCSPHFQLLGVRPWSGHRPLSPFLSKLQSAEVLLYSELFSRFFIYFFILTSIEHMFGCIFLSGLILVNTVTVL